MKLTHSHRLRQFSIFSLLGLFLFVNVVGVFGFIQPVSAQISVPITDANTGVLVGLGMKEAAKDAVKETKLSLKNALLQSFLSALVQGASYFTRKLAYDSAKWVANGGKGQSALAFKDGFGKYVERTAADAGATAVEEFGQGFGLSLCSLPNINLQLYLQLSIPQLYPEDSYGPTTSCTFEQLQNNWNDEGRRRWREQTHDRLAENFSRSLQVDTNSSDFGIALGAMGNIDRARASAKEANLLDRLEGGGFKSVTDLISGNILTPADVVRYETKSATQKDQGELQADQIAGIYGVQALNIIPQAGSIFLNTLVSEGLKNLLAKKGLIPQKTPGEAGEDSGPGRVTARDIEDAVSFFLKATTPRTGEEIDIVATMAACPSDSPGLNNCVMDNGLYTALIRESRNQQRLTIAEAIEEGLLNRDWPLIPPTNGLNDDLNCYDGRYCYSNIQKMRKLRILPLGFEVAALRSDPDQPWTLGQVVENFENCGPRNPDGSVNPDTETYPFCHLIDPNWVLREPVSRCEAEVYGPELAGNNTNIRREECVDVSTCVAFDENGKCEQYGYCTREQNVWEIPGEQCDQQFATCETFIDTQTKKASSFLTRTLDTDECTSDSVGCRAYSTEKVNGEWISVAAVTNNANEVINFKQFGRNRSIFFDKDILAKTCPNNQAGCSAFFLLDKTTTTAPFAYDFVRQNNQKVTVNIKKAPEYLNCYDTKPNEPGVQWPADLSELPLLSNAAECAQYAPVCLPEEVGCDGYTPVDGNDTVQVPGIIGQNACNAQCVGYAAYKQLASTFEPAKDPLYFIPKDADACSLEYVGCSEFTNLDELARGGESRAYFTDTAYCEKPADAARSNEKVFYTWEGSAQSGYVIKTHRLKRVSDTDRTILVELLEGATESSFANTNAPAVPQLSKTEIEAQYARCNEASYRDLINGGANPADADCREFIDEAGNRYYRLMGEVVRVSDQCSPYRISQPVLEKDGAIITPQTCENAKGLWTPTNGPVAAFCERCMGGGEYRDGACIYNILASESNSCPASANQCRSYTGNFASNIRTVAFFDFEPQGNTTAALNAARGSWDGGSVVAEAVQVGGSSLQVNANTVAFELAPGDVSTDAGRNIVHTLSLWARGQSQTIRIEFYQGDTQVGSFTGNTTSMSIGDNWRRYEFGPIAFTGSESVSTTVRFTRSGSGAYFIDNLRLSRVEDTYAFIKDSWKTTEGYNAPLACDTNPVDVFPGEQLGCTAYTQESNGETAYATGFQELCREEAIGCRALVDTYNTEAETGTLYNLHCTLTTTVGGISTVYQVPFGSNPQECTEWKDLTGASCMVEPGQTGCVVESAQFTSTSSSAVFNRLRFSDPYAIVIPSDTPTTIPIFLSTHSKYSCDGSKYLGCEIVGLETEALPGNDKSTFVTTTLINSPYIYKDTLCTKAEIGCSEYSTDKGLSYFKDPAVVGSLMCQYSKGDGISQRAGWYLDGIGRCGLPEALEVDVASSTTLPYCRTEVDCGGYTIGGTTTTCRAVNKTACYPNYLVNNGEFGLYSNSAGDNEYLGYVGMCPAAQNGCTEFIDRADTNPAFGGNGRPYYTILDDNALEAAGECGGKASLREGCVLFDQTNNPSRLYDTTATYARSEQAAISLGQYTGAEQPSLVSPETTGNLDSNTILKVGRNRECSEWLACRSSIPYTNADGRQEYLCYDYDVCNEASGENCGNFVSNTSTGFTGQYLSQENYVSRDTSWYGRDYSGYSLFNKYPVADFQSVVFGSIAVPTNNEQYAQQMKNPFLFYQVPNELMQGTNGARSCIDTATENPKADWTVCGSNSGGRCFSGSCLYPISGSFPAEFSSTTAQSQYTQFVTYAKPNECKAFPEEDSPFPQTVLIENNTILNRRVLSTSGEERWIFGAKQNKYITSAVCQDGNCMCDYNKVVYEDGTQDYFSASSLSAESIQGYCAAGAPDMIGAPCDVDTECSDVPDTPGYCVQKERIERRMGTLGFCLEYDMSRPINGTGADGINAPKYACLTWLPLEISASRIDTYNQDVLAGYSPDEDADGYGQVYCAQSTNRSGGEYISDMYLSTIPAPSTVESVDSIALGQKVFTNADMINLILSSSHFVPTSVPGVCPSFSSSFNIWTCFQSGHLTNTQRNYLDNVLELEGIATSTRNEFLDLFPTASHPATSTFSNFTNTYSVSGLGPMVLSDVFTSEGFPRIVSDGSSGFDSWGENWHGDEYECDPDDAPEDLYRSYFMCRNGSLDDLQLLYTTFQLWAWNYLKPSATEYGVNASLIRIEHHNSGDSFDKFNVGGIEQAFTLAPNVSLDSDSGVRMHPPRSWSSSPGSITQGIMNKSGVGYTDLFGPEFSGLHAGTNGVYHVAISPLEKEIHEQSLKEVYFLPLSYPDGEQGINPALVRKDVKINFDILRSAIEGVGENTSLAEVETGLAQNKDMQRSCDSSNGGNDEDGVIPSGNDGCATDDPSDRMDFRFGHDTTNDGARWSYVLDRGSDTDCGSLLSNCSYSGNGYSLDATYTTFANDRKNRIQRRYVTVFYSNTERYKPQFLSAATAEEREPRMLTEDPFATVCDGKGGNNGRNWFVIGMDFNEDGAFLGYISRFCHSGGGSNGIQYAVVATQYDMCTNFAVTHEQTVQHEQYNKAWTDRVWSGAPEDFGYIHINRSALQKPFASLVVESSDVSSATIGRLLYNSVFSQTIFGLPRSCAQSSMVERAFSNNCFGLTFGGTSLVTSNEIGTKTITNAQDSIADLFALSFKNSFLDLQTGVFSIGSVDDRSQMPTYVSDAEKPQIYSLNPFICNDEQSGKTCTAGERGYITVNGKNANTRDYNGDGAPDEDQMGAVNTPDGTDLIAVDSYQAQVRFFGMADRNHMPIRRVMVRWDESNNNGTTPDVLGFQKNRKPYCFGENALGGKECFHNVDSYVDPLRNTELTCKLDEECKGLFGNSGQCIDAGVSFGNSSRACQEGYFEFQHTYSCDAGDLQENGMSVSQIQSINGDMYSRLKSGYGLSDADRVCVYKPGVQVLDNWGWCNASTIPSDGMVNGIVVSSTPNPAGEYSGEYPAVVGTGGCAPTNSTAWSYFNGIIIVVPEDALPGNR